MIKSSNLLAFHMVIIVIIVDKRDVFLIVRQLVDSITVQLYDNRRS